ncbi:DNA polymerase III subunit beta [Candidatus Peribacteria bacterium RIFCSPLOWO2_01_FULL_51_18]|nr:MAG: DNA polymerase III subunit beta [Candidatus Peribacteria bacterium RIFCSPHIGHO2_02_FULL_51_15]OGJ66856.1 MAG: DNA polymerase III subunit beta [Candidatus Peribacteria bacterium RIFCSPLOWO2_01_FULL_51_18]OGJ69658.1 MAG: DNA polymerase III subunit beta [Candidatus Peribacteria bacterium RIFCSPLOWO2_02_FULL_51_10]
MKFSCRTADLLSGLQLVNRAIGSDQVLPILQNILIHIEGKRCTLSATNLEVSIVTSFEVTIENEGSITVPAKAILNFMQYNQDDEVVLETSEGTQLKLVSKRARAVVSGEASSGFPTITGIQKETTLALPVLPLLNALNLVTFACARTTSRPVISGVFVRLEKGQLTLVGTDSYRLSEYKIGVDSPARDISCIIPARFLEELKAVISLNCAKTEDLKDGDKGKKGEKAGDNVEIFLGAQQIEVHIGSTKLLSRLIDGKFPDYVQVLPKEKNTTATVAVKDLLGDVKRMHYFAKEQNNNITFVFDKSTINLSTKQTQIGRDESIINAKIEGQENKIAISSIYLIDFLSRIDAKEVRVELSDKMHPAVFRLADGGEFLHLIMPLRMSED